MDFDIIEGLTDEEIINLYENSDDIIADCCWCCYGTFRGTGSFAYSYSQCNSVCVSRYGYGFKYTSLNCSNRSYYC